MVVKYGAMAKLLKIGHKKKKKMVKIPKGRLSFALSSSFSTAGNIVEEFTNIMHPEIILKK